jgi:AraC family transcriptional regulator
MNANRSREVYIDRMHRVTEHIDQHLDQFLDLESLAEVAHFSPFHFHRLFSALMGETLGAYLRRRRCEVAATRLLAQPKLSVLQIALGVGFGSAEAFTHAFAARFGCSPTTWRLRQAAERAAISNPDQTNGKPDQAEGRQTRNNDLPKMQAETPMKIEIVEREPTPIAYLRHVGPYGEPIGIFWQAQVYPWMVTNGLIGQPRYGISQDDPRVTAQEQCRYDAGCELPDNVLVGGNAHRTTIPEVNTRRSASRAWLLISNRLGISFCANGCRPAVCNSTIGRCLSTTQRIQLTIRRPACSSASCVCL